MAAPFVRVPAPRGLRCVRTAHFRVFLPWPHAAPSSPPSSAFEPRLFPATLLRAGRRLAPLAPNRSSGFHGPRRSCDTRRRVAAGGVSVASGQRARERRQRPVELLQKGRRRPRPRLRPPVGPWSALARQGCRACCARCAVHARRGTALRARRGDQAPTDAAAASKRAREQELVRTTTSHHAPAHSGPAACCAGATPRHRSPPAPWACGVEPPGECTGKLGSEAVQQPTSVLSTNHCHEPCKTSRRCRGYRLGRASQIRRGPVSELPASRWRLGRRCAS